MERKRWMDSRFYKDWDIEVLKKLAERITEPELKQVMEQVLREKEEEQKRACTPKEVEEEHPPEPLDQIPEEFPPDIIIQEEEEPQTNMEEAPRIDLSPSGKTDAEIISVFKKALEHASEQYPNKVLPDLVTTFFVIDGIEKALEELFNAKCEDIAVYEWISEFYKRRWIKPPSDLSEPINWRAIPMIEILIRDPETETKTL